MAEHSAAEVRLVMDCRGGDWESLDGGWRCLYRGTVRLTQISLVDLGQLPRVVEAQVEWEQPTPTMFMPPVGVVEEEEPVEVLMTASEEESVNGPCGTYSSRSTTDGSRSMIEAVPKSNKNNLNAVLGSCPRSSPNEQ